MVLFLKVYPPLGLHHVGPIIGKVLGPLESVCVCTLYLEDIVGERV